VQNPEIILGDEPVSSVDPTLANTIVKLLIDISEQTKKTLVVSLHSVDLALAYFPRVIGIKNGKTSFDLPPDKISDTMLDDLYAGSLGNRPVSEAVSESTVSIVYPSVS
jgi:phosphonate transport system ATP-binding protein